MHRAEVQKSLKKLRSGSGMTLPKLKEAVHLAAGLHVEPGKALGHRLLELMQVDDVRPELGLALKASYLPIPERNTNLVMRQTAHAREQSLSLASIRARTSVGHKLLTESIINESSDYLREQYEDLATDFERYKYLISEYIDHLNSKQVRELVTNLRQIGEADRGQIEEGPRIELEMRKRGEVLSNVLNLLHSHNASGQYADFGNKVAKLYGETLDPFTPELMNFLEPGKDVLPEFSRSEPVRILDILSFGVIASYHEVVRTTQSSIRTNFDQKLAVDLALETIISVAVNGYTLAPR